MHIHALYVSVSCLVHVHVMCMFPLYCQTRFHAVAEKIPAGAVTCVTSSVPDGIKYKRRVVEAHAGSTVELEASSQLRSVLTCVDDVASIVAA